MLIVFVFGLDTEHVVNKNEYKLVAHVGDGFRHTFVNYYDYKNPFVRGKQLRLYESYGDGAFDPIKPKNGYTRDVVRFTWYDDNGNPIRN
jgi:hypothetical protein